MSKLFDHVPAGNSGVLRRAAAILIDGYFEVSFGQLFHLVEKTRLPRAIRPTVCTARGCSQFP
jgi:hypothetical protein